MVIWRPIFRYMTMVRKRNDHAFSKYVFTLELHVYNEEQVFVKVVRHEEEV